jgi:hypothetical protein
VVATIGKMIEPVVLIVAGIMFAIIIGGLFLPVYDLVSTVGGRLCKSFLGSTLTRPHLQGGN